MSNYIHLLELNTRVVLDSSSSSVKFPFSQIVQRGGGSLPGVITPPQGSFQYKHRRVLREVSITPSLTESYISKRGTWAT